MIDCRAVQVAGYCTVFDEIGLLADDNYEMFAPHAFDGMVGARVGITLHDHEAAQLGHATILFRDRHGVGFISDPIDCSYGAPAASLPSALTGGVNACSIGLVDISKSEPASLYDLPIRRVLSARFDHVCLCQSDFAAYKSTSAWICGVPLDRAPNRLRQAAARWSLGHSKAILQAQHHRDAEDLRTQRLEARYSARMAAQRRPHGSDRLIAARHHERLTRLGAIQ